MKIEREERCIDAECRPTRVASIAWSPGDVSQVITPSPGVLRLMLILLKTSIRLVFVNSCGPDAYTRMRERQGTRYIAPQGLLTSVLKL